MFSYVNKLQRRAIPSTDRALDNTIYCERPAFNDSSTRYNVYIHTVTFESNDSVFPITPATSKHLILCTEPLKIIRVYTKDYVSVFPATPTTRKHIILPTLSFSNLDLYIQHSHNQTITIAQSGNVVILTVVLFCLCFSYRCCYFCG